MMFDDFSFDQGVLKDHLKMGVVSSVAADSITINLFRPVETSGHYISGSRYGKGEVGELILIEGQQSLILARLLEIKLNDKERSEIAAEFNESNNLAPLGVARFLGTVTVDDLSVKPGVVHYPRLGDRVFSAPSEFIASIPELMNSKSNGCKKNLITLSIGYVTGAGNSEVKVTPEKLFGRHCAVLGSTGGGKSWTTAKIIEECARHEKSKTVLIDATSEYRDLDVSYTYHCHINDPVNKSSSSEKISVSPTDFIESDFIAIFNPSGKVQGPKLMEAIKSLRLVHLASDLFPSGIVNKINQSKKIYRQAMNRPGISGLVDNPSQPFNVNNLIKQVVQECCWDEGDSWGKPNNDIGYCSSLLTRISAVLSSNSLKSVFKDANLIQLGSVFESFWSSDKSVLRLCLSGVSYEFYAREILANVIGRKLLETARREIFRERPVLIVVDEAHNFLGKHMGTEDHLTKLDAFEMIAKEGRKYGLNICLTTQRPRDITEGVLSQIGTLLVHRLTNDSDRQVVERACGEIDRSSASFLPNLRQGEIALVGTDFPIPMTVQVEPPHNLPKSDGPNFQNVWSK